VSSHEGRPVLPAAAGLSAGAARRSALLLTAWLAAAPAAAVEVPFLEDFASEDDAATWRNATVQDVDWAASGGPDGGAHIETTLNYFGFENPFGGGPVVFRAQDEFGASGGAFEGDWLDAGVGLLGLGAIGRRRRV
jgi:hypothetical protein